EGDDAMMEEFFREGTIPINDLIPAVRKAIVAEKIFPVLITSATHNIATSSLLTFLADAFPHPDEHAQVGYKDPGGKGDRVERKYDDSQPVSLFVFKTLADPFAGRINYFKVKSGILKNDATLQNYNRNTPERLQHIQVVQGKQLTEVGELHAGDLGAIAKLKETTTGETLGDKAAPMYYTPARIPEPSITFAIEPGKGIEFVDDIFGGAIPKNWIPSVEKGIRDAAARGYLAGFPVTDFRAILYDGKYHDVDSSDIAFKIAGTLAFKEAMKQARP